MQRSDITPLVVSLLITAALIGGSVYFFLEIWPLLPPVIAMIFFILLAVMVIGYPIYALARWSNRYLTRSQQAGNHSDNKENRPRD